MHSSREVYLLTFYKARAHFERRNLRALSLSLDVPCSSSAAIKINCEESCECEACGGQSTRE